MRAAKPNYNHQKTVCVTNRLQPNPGPLRMNPQHQVPVQDETDIYAEVCPYATVELLKDDQLQGFSTLYHQVRVSRNSKGLGSLTIVETCGG